MPSTKGLIERATLPVPAQSFEGKSYIGIIIDKSGSMAPVVDDVIGGFNHWLESLQVVDGSERAIVSCTLFNTGVEERNVLDSLASVRPLDRQSYVPGGGTALLDATYTTIKKLEGSVGTEDRALVLIITDGQENSSVEIRRAQLRDLIQELTDRGNWTFAYLGSDPSTFSEASAMGVSPRSARRHAAGRAGIADAFASASRGRDRWMASDRKHDEAFFEEDDSESAPPSQ